MLNTGTLAGLHRFDYVLMEVQDEIEFGQLTLGAQGGCLKQAQATRR